MRALGAFAWRRRRRVALLVLALSAAPLVLLAILAALTSLPDELLEPPAPSVRVTSRTGQLLREVRADDGARARPLPLSDFPPHVRHAVLAAEDRRFYSHHGIDFVAVGRAAISNVVHRRIVSGASTITMQLARTLRPRPRSAWGKLREGALALRIEASLSKDRILEEYLNRVVYGPNLRGYAAASHAYFGVAPESLSLAGAALIAGLPRGPSLYNVTRRPDLAERRRNRVLERMEEASMIGADAKERATSEPIVTALDRPAFGAPHLVRAIVSGRIARWQPGLEDALGGGASEIRTTIDPDIQRAAEGAVTSALASLKEERVTAAAVVVLENATGEVLAYVGSPDFFSEEALGQNDGVLALRQPGSALKPFVYAEAMARFGFSGATLLPDLELHIPLPGGGQYIPRNYDMKHRGPVRLRDALGNSLNVPAVYTAQQLGTVHVLERLHAFGFASLTEDAEHYGPALALGNGEVTLLELANAYATLARGGAFASPRVVSALVKDGARVDLAAPPPMRVLDERITAMVTDILADKAARMSAFGDQNVLELDYDVAAKTGTSKGYRDNVAAGYTRDVTVAVWAGNFDAAPMSGVSGISGAGPIFRSVMDAATAKRGAPGRLSPAADAARLGLARTSVCALSGDIPSGACPHRVDEWLPEGDRDHAPRCSTHVRLRVDRRNGLRAGPGCASDVAESRIMERWRPPFDEWARRLGRSVVPEGSSPACPAPELEPLGGAAAPLRITYPFEGARFVVDPERPPSLQLLEIRVEPNDPRVEVRVSGALLPDDRRWPLTPGAHTITARTKDGETAPPVRFTVR